MKALEANRGVKRPETGFGIFSLLIFIFLGGFWIFRFLIDFTVYIPPYVEQGGSASYRH